MKFKQIIPKSEVSCDETIKVLLKDIVQRNEDCIVLVSFKIREKEIELTYEDEHCEEMT